MEIIADKLQSQRPLLSVEFFPPKDESGGEQIIRTATALWNFCKPDYVSITYGAAGTTRERTQRYAQLLKNRFEFAVMPHLTCVGTTRGELRAIIESYRRDGFRNIMALRGDPPKGSEHFRAHPDGFRYASELVAMIRDSWPDLCVGVAGYPEKHPEAPDAEIDIQNLIHKCGNGASFVTTQLFFSNQVYFDFVQRCRSAGLQLPIIAGIMPVLSLNQIRRFCGLCGATVPADLIAELESANGDVESERVIGVRWARRQIRELLERGAPGVHLYILNRSESILALVRGLRQDGVL